MLLRNRTQKRRVNANPPAVYVRAPPGPLHPQDWPCICNGAGCRLNRAASRQPDRSCLAPLNIDHDETRIKTSNQQNWLDSNGNSKANEEQSKGSQNARSTSTRHSSTADQSATICRSNRQRISQRDLLEYRIMANEVNTRSTTKQIRFHLIRQIAFRQRKETRID